MSTLPPATATPCSECPWRTESLRGYLGPLSAEEWTEVARSEEPIACHRTLPGGKNPWTHPATRQCRGAAAYRQNTCKMPRNPDDAANTTRHDPRTPDIRETVFRNARAFEAHHNARETGTPGT